MASQTQAARVTAANQLGALETAINKLGDASLSAIASDMQANAQGLTQTTQALNDALKDITKVQSIMSAMTGVINVVAKIIPLV